MSVESGSGRPLGETEVEYFDDPSIYPILFRHLASKYDGSDGHAHGDTSNSSNGESSDGNAHGDTSNSANGDSSNGNIQGDTGSSGNGGKLRYLLQKLLMLERARKRSLSAALIN